MDIANRNRLKSHLSSLMRTARAGDEECVDAVIELLSRHFSERLVQAPVVDALARAGLARGLQLRHGGRLLSQGAEYQAAWARLMGAMLKFIGLGIEQESASSTSVMFMAFKSLFKKNSRGEVELAAALREAVRLELGAGKKARLGAPLRIINQAELYLLQTLQDDDDIRDLIRRRAVTLGIGRADLPAKDPALGAPVLEVVAVGLREAGLQVDMVDQTS